jgi:hypothetical protein
MFMTLLIVSVQNRGVYIDVTQIHRGGLCEFLFKEPTQRTQLFIYLACKILS